MKKEDLKQMILKEAIYIKNLVEEKKKIEKQLQELDLKDIPFDNPEGMRRSGVPVPEEKPIEKDKEVDEMMGVSKTVKHQANRRQELREEEIEETTGKGLGVQHRASHKGETGEKLKVEDNLEEGVELLRKAIRKQLYESYQINEENIEEEEKWIQKAVDPEHKGYCTPMTKPTCTPKRKALAKRFKKGIEK